MKIKINKTGNLEIERAGKWRAQQCPGSLALCGGTCPLFGEPEIYTRGDLVTNTLRLDLCHVTLEGEITDERGK